MRGCGGRLERGQRKRERQRQHDGWRAGLHARGRGLAQRGGRSALQAAAGRAGACSQVLAARLQGLPALALHGALAAHG